MIKLLQIWPRADMGGFRRFRKVANSGDDWTGAELRIGLAKSRENCGCRAFGGKQLRIENLKKVDVTFSPFRIENLKKVDVTFSPFHLFTVDSIQRTAGGSITLT